MFFNKIFHFVKGYVIIKVSGVYTERFLYICAKRGIVLFKIGEMTEKQILLCMSISDFYKIRSVRRKTGSHICIVKKCGLPFILKKIKKRYALIAVGIFFAAFFVISSQFIWSVEISGVGGECSEKLASAAQLAGVEIGRFKPNLKSGEEIKSIILNNTDNIVWAWVNIKGTKAVIEAKEGIRPPATVDKSKLCNIVAARDAIILKTVEKNGSVTVVPGAAVLKGDILIASEQSVMGEVKRRVHAMGEVYGYTWHEKSGEYKLYSEAETPTGNKKSYFCLKLFSKCFNLFTKENPSFDNYVIDEKLFEIKFGKENYSGIGIYRKTYFETETKRAVLSYDEVVESAKRDLEGKIARELLPQARLKNVKTEHEKTDDETVRVTVTMEFVEKIDCEEPITEF